MDNSLSKNSTYDKQNEEFFNIELKSNKSNATATESELNDSKLDSQKGTLKRKMRQYFSVFTLFRKRKNENENNIDEELTSPEKDKSSILESTISPSIKGTKGSSINKRDSLRNSSITKETFNDFIEKGNTYFQQGDYQEAANLYSASLIINRESEEDFHKKMASIYAELAAIDLDRNSYNAQAKKVKQEITEEKGKCQVNLSTDNFLNFLSKLNMQQIKDIAMEFSRYSYALQKRLAEYKKVNDLRKYYTYTVVKFERIKTVFGIIVTAHLIDKSSNYEVVILPNYFIQSLNHSVINDYNKCLSGKKIKMIYRGKDKFGERLSFKV